jgi:hypothetical protein
MVTLVKKINGTFKSKLKSHTPINIAISKADSELLKRFPRLSLENIRNNNGIFKDWYNLTFRTKIGLEVANLVYTEEASAALKEVHDVCLKMLETYKQERCLSLTEQEYILLTDGLDAVDQMQDENTRRILLDIFKNSDKYVKKLIVEAVTDIN